MKLLVIGCSHSAGSEIVEQWHPSCPERAYGGYLYKNLGFTEYVNIAGPGWSNEWIYHTMVEYLARLRDPKEWFVVIGWTNSMRKPVFCYEKNEVVHLCPNHRNLEVFSKPIQKAYDHLYGTSIPLNVSTQMEHSRIIGMQSLLKQLGISYLFFDAVCSNHEWSTNNLIDLSRYFKYGDNDQSFWRKYQLEYWDGGDRWANHAPEWYHKVWAEELTNFIKENNLLDTVYEQHSR